MEDNLIATSLPASQTLTRLTVNAGVEGPINATHIHSILPGMAVGAPFGLLRINSVKVGDGRGWVGLV